MMDDSYSQSSLSYHEEYVRVQRGEDRGFLWKDREDNADEIDEIVDRFQCMTKSTKQSEELSWEKYSVWRQEQKNRAIRLEKQLRSMWELEELIEEQLNRFHAHYIRTMLPTRLKHIPQLLMPKWTPPLELTSIAWLGDWRPSSILDLVRGLTRFGTSDAPQLLSQLIHETRIEEAILDEEMAEIQATCILNLPFTSVNAQRNRGTPMTGVRSEYKKIEKVILKAQQLRYKVLEKVLKKVLNQIEAAEFLVAFEGIQDKIHQIASHHKFQKCPVTVSIKALTSN